FQGKTGLVGEETPVPTRYLPLSDGRARTGDFQRNTGLVGEATPLPTRSLPLSDGRARTGVCQGKTGLVGEEPPVPTRYLPLSDECPPTPPCDDTDGPATTTWGGRVGIGGGVVGRGGRCADPGLPESCAENHDIAVVGIAGRFPHAENLEELWQVLLNGEDCFEPVPP